MKSWFSGKKGMFCVGADVGGSGIRYQISNFDSHKQTIDIPHQKAKSAQDIYDTASNLYSAIQKECPGAVCRGSSFAIAGLRVGVTVNLLNWPGPDSKRTIDMNKMPQSMYPKHHSFLLNDLEAGAYGLISAKEAGDIDEYFERLFGPKNTPIISERGNTGLFAMGSGLGAALLTHDAKLQPLVLATEAGYFVANNVQHNHPNYEKERKYFNFIIDKLYGGVKINPGFEDIASGKAINYYYTFLGGNSETPVPEIVELAKKGDEKALESMKMHYVYFVRCIKQMSVTMKCDSSLMALSNQVANRWLVHQMIPQLEEEFNEYVRPEWTRKIAVWAQKKDRNFNIDGTTYMAQYVARNTVDQK